jgi:hypothetical protein
MMPAAATQPAVAGIDPAPPNTASVYALTNRLLSTGLSLSLSKVVNVIFLSRLQPQTLSALASLCISSL